MERLTSKKDIFIGLLVLAVIAGVIVWLQRPREELRVEITPTPIIEEIEERIRETFKVEIPDDVERAVLTDVTDGDASGLAVRKYEAGVFTHTVLADLSDPELGFFYEGWLVRGQEGDDDFAFISTGKMRLAKGGFVLEFSSQQDLTTYERVVITLERVDNQKPEKHILEGSF